MTIRCPLALAALLLCSPVQAEQDHNPPAERAGRWDDGNNRPMRAGREARPDRWNSDGAPRPPRMWRGHGGDAWPNHYKACKHRYRNYDYRTDMYRLNGRRLRCVL